MSTYDPDDRIDDLLRSTLLDEAETVHPAGDGLARIQQRVAARRTRLRWLRPLAAVGSAAAVTAAGLGAYALVGGSSGTATVNVPPAHTPTPVSSSPAPTASETVPATDVRFPARAIYPFTNAADEAGWEATRDNGSAIAAGDPKTVATLFVADFLREPSVSTVTDTMIAQNGRTAAVTLGRTISGTQQTHAVTTVRLVRFRHAWLVVGADDAGGMLKVTSPTAAQTVTSPLTVSGPGFGVDEVAQVDLRTPDEGVVGSTGHASFGSGTPQWSTTLTFATPAEPVGAVVAVDNSSADGLPGRIAVVPVRFGTVVAASYPDHFVGIKTGRVTVFASRDGAALSYLTPAPADAKAAASDPQLEGDIVYYLQAAGTCSSALMSVPLAGGTPTLVAAPATGYQIRGYAVSADGTKTALFETTCRSPVTGQPQGQLVSTDRTTSRTHTIAFPGLPPEVVGDPSWAPDGEHLDAFVRGGNMGAPTRYDAFAATSWSDSVASCRSGQASGPAAQIETDGSGSVWYAIGTGSSIEVGHCANNTWTKVFSIAGQRYPTDLDVTSDGSAVLVTDDSGDLWRWNQGGGLTQLHPSVPMTGVSW